MSQFRQTANSYVEGILDASSSSYISYNNPKEFFGIIEFRCADSSCYKNMKTIDYIFHEKCRIISAFGIDNFFNFIYQKEQGLRNFQNFKKMKLLTELIIINFLLLSMNKMTYFYTTYQNSLLFTNEYSGMI